MTGPHQTMTIGESLIEMLETMTRMAAVNPTEEAAHALHNANSMAKAFIDLNEGASVEAQVQEAIDQAIANRKAIRTLLEALDPWMQESLKTYGKCGAPHYDVRDCGCR